MKKIVSAPLRMSPELKAKLDLASEKLGIKQAEVMRLALDIGLADLRSIDWDLAGCVVDAVNARRSTSSTEASHLKVAEDPAPYQTPPKENGGKS